MLIADSPVGQDLRLVHVDLDDGRAFRLRELGLAPGVRLKVVQRAAFGGRVVQIGGERFAIDAVTAKRLHADVVAVPQSGEFAAGPAA